MSSYLTDSSVPPTASIAGTGSSKTAAPAATPAVAPSTAPQSTHTTASQSTHATTHVTTTTRASPHPPIPVASSSTLRKQIVQDITTSKYLLMVLVLTVVFELLLVLWTAG